MSESINEIIQRVDDALGKLDADIDAAECHGTLSGMFCARNKTTLDEWLAAALPPVAPGDALAAEARALLEIVYRHTRAGLDDPLLQFQPLIPDEETSLATRARALGEWCQGFLHGLALGGVEDLDRLPEDSREAVQDLVAIAAIEEYELSGEEEDEQALQQLLEFVRTVAMMVNEELNPTQAPPRMDSTVH